MTEPLPEKIATYIKEIDPGYNDTGETDALYALFPPYVIRNWAGYDHNCDYAVVRELTMDDKDFTVLMPADRYGNIIAGAVPLEFDGYLIGQRSTEELLLRAGYTLRDQAASLELVGADA